MVDTTGANTPFRVRAKLFEGRSTRFSHVWLEVSEDHELSVADQSSGQAHGLEITEFPDRIQGVADSLMVVLDGQSSDAPRRLELVDPLPAGFVFPGQRAEQSWLSIVEGAPARFALLLVALAALGFIVYRAALGWGVGVVVAMIPTTVEDSLSERVLRSMDDGPLFNAPTEEFTKQQEIMDLAVADFAKHFDQAQVPKVLIRSSREFGANAFAFPNGPIVVTQELLELEPSTVALQGLMAHEYAHIYRRHHMRDLVRVVGIVVLGGLVFGGEGFTPDEMIAVATPLIQSGLSRRAESEADEIAHTLMHDVGYERDGMIQMLEVLNEDCQPSCLDFGLLSTHPPLEKRIEALNQLDDAR